MRTSRAVVVVGGCVAIVSAGWAAAPKEVPTLDLADPSAAPSADPGATAGVGDGASAEVIDGPVVTNLRGDFQARITVEDGVVTSVEALAAGTQDAQSVQINARAIPELTTRVLEAQTWDVDHVSGASYTSPGFLESVQGAFADAGL